MNKTNILEPTLPRLPGELEDFQFVHPGQDEWLDIINNLVLKEELKSIQKLRVEASKLSGTLMNGLKLDKCELSDVAVKAADITAFQTYKASFQRVSFVDTRATGADFAEGYFEDCLFKNVKLDEAGFRMAQFKRVCFENCVLNKTDFYQAKLSQVRFENCELEYTSFDQALCKSVDLRGENLSLIKGILGLKHAIISQEQLIQIAPLLAHELNFSISD